jgi:hypothetical protein
MKIHRLPEPTLAQMAQNFTQALGLWAASGFQLASQAETLRRAATCQSCEFWSPDARLGLGKCHSRKCGCTKLKWWLKMSTCPEGNWVG